MSKLTVPIRLAALDLDGTLLDSRSAVTPATQQAIEKAASLGVVVLPATGRPLASLPPVVAKLPGVRYAITSNGAAVWDLGANPLASVYSRYANAAERETAEPVCIIKHIFTAEKAREVFDVFMRFNGELSIFSDGKAIKSAESMRRFEERFRKRHSTEAKQPNDGRFHIVRDPAEWMSRNAHEIEKLCMFFDSIEQAQTALSAFTALDGVEVVQGSPDNIEVTAKGVDKGEALLGLAQYLGIQREATLAVGDSENDLAMLQKAGVSAAMCNGMEHIKAAADYVSTKSCNEDGVAELFSRLGLLGG